MSIISRLRKLEAMRPGSLVLSVEMPDGTVREMSAPEYYEAARMGAKMIRVLRGNCLDDLDLILKTIHFAINEKGEEYE